MQCACVLCMIFWSPEEPVLWEFTAYTKRGVEISFQKVSLFNTQESHNPLAGFDPLDKKRNLYGPKSCSILFGFLLIHLWMTVALASSLNLIQWSSRDLNISTLMARKLAIKIHGGCMLMHICIPMYCSHCACSQGGILASVTPIKSRFRWLACSILELLVPLQEVLFVTALPCRDLMSAYTYSWSCVSELSE